MRPEILIVDSGSTDRTRAIVRGRCGVQVDNDRAVYRLGAALNIGATAASGDIHLALSSHCRFTRQNRVKRSLAVYDDASVAGTNALDRTPQGERIDGVYHQMLDDVRRWPRWEFSNHASSWRADVWCEFPSMRICPQQRTKSGRSAYSGQAGRWPTHPSSTSRTAMCESPERATSSGVRDMRRQRWGHT